MTGSDGATSGADPAVVGPFLAKSLDDERWRDCTVTLVAGGKSNLTFVVTSDAGEAVLRRPPTGAILPTAHDMHREHTVISALADTPVPVPRVLATCDDADVLGQPFYVMERVAGYVIRDALPAGYAETEAERAHIADRLVTTLADLHGVDIDAVGLSGFGRPDGFMERQVGRWTRQSEATRSGPVPALDALAGELVAQLPDSGAGTIVHGDFRLDNCILDAHDVGRVAAVLDWEMSTLGDPLADVGLLLIYWAEQGDDRGAALAVVPSITALPGFPTRAEVAQHYARLTGRDLSELPFYVAFGYFKLAVVVQGIVARSAAGAMGGQGFGDMERLVTPLVERGRAVLADRTLG
jgi:aminoglycoside phosphotransferase (APT) family kinase protein